ncbi:TIGR04282 family arsenosugar biosynthesis glycosyltransferase [Roseovarius nanhaiticus]|uniref:TIGR04282 family arsenosugar biosynthesis glycosyltransferase n=1 Tax=Roseovarius nanhaiticus TaxID=573024 RepID=UPI000B84F980|nr:TIGR04282 family arsenosugar biosynthesis glycosyltransferase [Roseovarius nanhaiticus]
MRPTLVIMLKEPRPGRVKTRLGREIGMTAAAWWFRHQTARLIRRLEDPRWRLVLAVAPDRAGLASRVWPAHLPRVAQGQGDLGARMARLLRGVGQGPICIIGGDIPGIRAAHVARAFAALGAHDAVFGPAPDGGYWLIGLKRSGGIPARFLGDVRWSTEHALQDSCATLPDARIAYVDTLRDVDTAADLAQAR